MFDAPGWIADSKVSRAFDTPDQQQRKAYRTTTHDIGHLTSPGVSPAQDEGLLARIVEAEREKEKRIAEFRANEFMGSLLVPRRRLVEAVIEMAPKYDVTLVACPGLLEEEAPTTFTVKTDGPLAIFTSRICRRPLGSASVFWSASSRSAWRDTDCCREPLVEVVVRDLGLRLPATSRRFEQ